MLISQRADNFSAKAYQLNSAKLVYRILALRSVEHLHHKDACLNLVKDHTFGDMSGFRANGKMEKEREKN